MGVPAQKAGRAVMRHAWHRTCERIQRPKRTIQHHLYVTSAMTAKLTLRLDEQLIAAAKDYAQAHNRSVSALVADYFAQLTRQAQPEPAPVNSPWVSSLRGVLAHAVVDEEDHRQHLATKHQ